MKLEFSLMFFSKNTQTSNVIKIRPVGAEFFFMRTDGRTDMTKLIVALSKFCERKPHSIIAKNTPLLYSYTTYIISITVIQPLGRSGQRPELSQATGMAVVCCILGKFLGGSLPLLSPTTYIYTYTKF